MKIENINHDHFIIHEMFSNCLLFHLLKAWVVSNTPLVCIIINFIIIFLESKDLKSSNKSN